MDINKIIEEAKKVSNLLKPLIFEVSKLRRAVDPEIISDILSNLYSGMNGLDYLIDNITDYIVNPIEIPQSKDTVYAVDGTVLVIDGVLTQFGEDWVKSEEGKRCYRSFKKLFFEFANENGYDSKEQESGKYLKLTVTHRDTGTKHQGTLYHPYLMSTILKNGVTGSAIDIFHSIVESGLKE